MITQEIIQRINELSKKKKSLGLTPAEQAEQASLRRIYLDNIKTQLKDCLDCIEIVDEPKQNNDNQPATGSEGRVH